MNIEHFKNIIKFEKNVSVEIIQAGERKFLINTEAKGNYIPCSLIE